MRSLGVEIVWRSARWIFGGTFGYNGIGPRRPDSAAGGGTALEINMKPRLSVFTLCVDDLARSFRFYHEGLGLRSAGIIGREFEHGAVAFFDLQPGSKLALWPRKSLCHGSGLAPSGPSAAEFALGHNDSTLPRPHEEL
jgi:hypothetical protein